MPRIPQKMRRAIRHVRLLLNSHQDAVLGVAAGAATIAAGDYVMMRGWLPYNASDFDIGVAGVCSGLIASLPLLRSITWAMVSAALSVWTSAITAIGAGVVAIFVYEPLSDGVFTNMPTGSRQGALAITVALASFGGLLGLMKWAYRPNRTAMAYSGASFAASGDRWDVVRAAKHEAGHALVACVLGLPLAEVHVKVVPDRHGSGGSIRIDDNKTPITDIGEVCSQLLRRVSVELSGVMAEKVWASPADAAHRLSTQTDYSQACGHMFSIGLMVPAHPSAGNEILDATWKDMNARKWRDAIQEGSELLLRNDMVAADAFHAIAGHWGLSLPSVAAVISRVTR